MQNFNYPYNTYNSYASRQYAFVNGLEGAKSYQMQPNQMVMLLDSDSPIVYKKTSNAYGQATIECFKMVSISEQELKGINTQPETKYVSKDEFIALQQKVEELLKQKEMTDNA